MAIRKLKAFKEKLPGGKIQRKIDAMRHGDYEEFAEEREAVVFAQSVCNLRQIYKRRIFHVLRRLPEGYYRVWVLRY